MTLEERKELEQIWYTSTERRDLMKLWGDLATLAGRAKRNCASAKAIQFLDKALKEAKDLYHQTQQDFYDNPMTLVTSIMARYEADDERKELFKKAD